MVNHSGPALRAPGRVAVNRNRLHGAPTTRRAVDRAHSERVAGWGRRPTPTLEGAPLATHQHTKRSRSGTQRRQRPGLAATRLTQAELDQLRAKATERGQSVSEYLRGLVTEAIA